MKRIGVLTSGGDAPGMNAAIRSIVRNAIYNGLEVMGIERGYAGLISGDVKRMNLASVSGIINRGGTILRTARCEEFKSKEGRIKASEVIKKNKIDGMIVIGGEGSFHGAKLLDEEWDIPTIGVPGSIDNDINGTDYSIGYDTAVNTALEAVDKIRDTATSHERLFVIEVMGRTKGFIALAVGLGGGAEAILIPEMQYDIEDMCGKLKEGKRRGKVSSIIVVAEGAGSAMYIGDQISRRTDFDVRVSILGHLQRGGAPTALDREIASRLGAAAAEQIIAKKRKKMVGIVANKVVVSDIEDAWKIEKKIDMEIYKLANILAI